MKKIVPEKKCLCGRIITDTRNKTGLCPKCQKKANSVGASVLLTTGIAAAKKWGPKALKFMTKSFKK